MTKRKNPIGGLNPAQEKFCQAYALDPNGAEAYARTYPLSRTWKPRSRAANALRLLAQEKIRTRIEVLRAALVAKAEKQFDVTVERIVAELAKIAFANMLDYVKIQPDGSTYVDVGTLSRAQAAALQELTIETYTDGRGEDARDVKRVKFKLADKRAALVDLGKHLKMFTERHEHTGKDGKPIEVNLSDFERARRLVFLLASADQAAGSSEQ